ncbi:MAG: hypothetical protein AVDCRST_MAG88-2756 [uncultured Thermomicrobiales bacterium]|uniref:Dual OB-containing domain-containing protein n=1 Tax=uncultured Thermomicrobiales bacterium TaxID=1645740 RepID=A0A6J4VED0_9BACT|nr:MAG: hypothetical protein AVDCRST_MAG88-2756 [uncultured Thermomicrobiales bacterium]
MARLARLAGALRATRIICLANSWKRREHCIAGIDPVTGRWVRPVTDTPDGSVPRYARLIYGAEPALLDILEIPLAPDGPDFGCECENRLILPGTWRRAGRARRHEVLRYCVDDDCILHTPGPFVPLAFLQALPPERRHSLQLVETVKFAARRSRQRDNGRNKWQGTFVTRGGQRLTARITDPALVLRLEAGDKPSDRCLVTVSLSLPWRRDERAEECCYKLIAGVFDLAPRAAPALDLSDVPF